MKKLNVAIVGATGLVGRTFIQVLEERQFPIHNIYFFASSRSKGKTIMFNQKEYEVEELTPDVFKRDVDVALFSAGGEISLKYAPIAKKEGVVVIDNSSTWRMHDDVPLVVPEVNPEHAFLHQGIIANPNCSTIQSVVPLGVLHERYGIKRIVYSTYQAVSGSGVKGLEDLEKGIKGEKPTTYPHPIAFNCLPQIDVFMKNGYTKEEMKMINETKKILGDDEIGVTATTVRVPVRHGHSVSINLEFERPFEVERLKQELLNIEGVVLMDDVNNLTYPMPIQAEGTDAVYIGRIRRDFSVRNGVNLWIVADNIRKGAATNTVQIAELLVRSGQL